MESNNFLWLTWKFAEKLGPVTKIFLNEINCIFNSDMNNFLSTIVGVDLSFQSFDT